MRWEDYRKSETIAISHCATRDICPLGRLCGVEGEGAPSEGARTQELGGPRVLTPALAEVAKDELIWVSWRNEHRVIVIKSGLFAVFAAGERDGEVIAIYGPGYCCGLAELYIDENVCYTYYLKALVDSTICSFPANALRHRLELLPTAESNSIMSCSITNWAAATFEMLKLYSSSRKSDRLALVLKYIRKQSGRLGSPLSVIRLSHDELAELLRSDRASVTRALHRLEEEGLVSLGYKSITLCNDFDSRVQQYSDLELAFHVPGPLGEE